MTPLFDPPEPPMVPISQGGRGFPVRRIFCVGRNYAAHAAEMGNEVDREAPFYFTKSPSAICDTGRTVPYPPGTIDFHHEMELVVAIGAPAFRVEQDAAMAPVLGYAAGLDMTRRDLQQKGKDARRPWDLGKDFENSAVIGPITPAAQFTPGRQRIAMMCNGVVRQDARLDDMIWSVPEIVADLSRYYHLDAGDLIYTGTPAGVGPVSPGDVLQGMIEGLAQVELTIGAPQ
ncbi:MAG: fumarylacetoacetate hydrolase family protein [Sediminimonas qiaohouensis]|uniref:Fumarylacetoacetate hydrolase family protein n=1 Tax=Sediminimonas qiaohouensis TaxID=552061 RepID=A0A7C9H9Z4_9RHOB|nr:fumarylacetoacetate hydrolase family protein [Sediminimonas qiaohouensis]MTJ03829.1 fumarylacetoacetate hydrolase family protein [Sediminimonas qiaohouensis]